jgi:hypothetical protein
MRHSLFGSILVSLLMACSLGDNQPPGNGQGGSSNGTGGSADGTGGSSNTGGSTGTGGSSASGGSNGTGGSSSTGGSNATGGSSATGGSTGTGGGTPDASSAGGSAGTSTTPDSGAGGMVVRDAAPDLPATTTPFAVLDNQQFVLPCLQDESYSNLVCQNKASAAAVCPNTAAANYIDRGFKNRDETITIAGTPGTVYDVTIRVRGVVEPKHYQGGVKDTVHDGFYSGGTPVNSGAYNVYMLGVSDPPTPGVYYLNAVNFNEGHFDYPMDYTVTIPIAAGARVRFLAADANCSAIKNCDPSSRDTAGGPQSDCHQNVVPGLTAPGIVQPVRGQFVVINLVSAVAR